VSDRSAVDKPSNSMSRFRQKLKMRQLASSNRRQHGTAAWGWPANMGAPLARSGEFSAGCLVNRTCDCPRTQRRSHEKRSERCYAPRTERASGSSPSRFFQIASWACALAKRSPLRSLDWCISGLHLNRIKADRARLRALHLNTMPKPLHPMGRVS
jgi:hypothetical protein